jgi:hypothetical protein
MKRLPIQLVKTRGEQDMFWKEGMGDNKLPKWATQATITAHAGVMMETFSAVERYFDKREEGALPVLMVASLDEKATNRKSFRANVRAVFDRKNTRNVLGKESQRGLLVKVNNRNDLQAISRRVEDAGRGEGSKDRLCGVAVVENLQLFHPFVEDGLDGGKLKVQLVDYHNEKLNVKSDELLQEYGVQNNVIIRRLDYAKGLRLYAIDNATPDVVAAMATMDAVISVKRMPYFELAISPEPYNTSLEVKNPNPEESYPRVGILDSGVELIPHLAPWFDRKEQNVANLADEDIRHRHGTSVAGIVNYGDELQGERWTGTIPSLITSCVVNTDERAARISEEEMVEHIRTAIAQNPDVKVWNLSQGSTIEIRDDEFSDFAVAIDELQKEYQVLICKSAGNVRPEEPDSLRITQGADSVMSLVVGSIAHVKVMPEDAEVGKRSPFSRVGLGPSGITKPDLVHYGGNMSTGVYSFSEVGYQTNAFRGTSHATPRVTALASNIALCIDKQFDPLMVRALLIHSAGYQNLDELENDDIRRELGFGKPAVLDDILYNDPDEFTMVMEPQFADRDYQIQDIPFPEELVGEDGFFEGEVTVTVVTEPVRRGGERGEYCQSDVEVLLQTYDHTGYYVLGAYGTPRSYRNAERLEDAENVLAKRRYSAHSFNSLDLSKRTMIFGESYFPIKKYHVNLSQMIPSQKVRCLSANRKWGMSIKTMYRDATISDKEAGTLVDNIRAVVILTIKDPKRRGIVYDRCMAKLDAHNFVHNAMSVRQQINVIGEA